MLMYNGGVDMINEGKSEGGNISKISSREPWVIAKK